jgi:hypothetical protein
VHRWKPTFDSLKDDLWTHTLVPGLLQRAEAMDPKTQRVLGTLLFE